MLMDISQEDWVDLAVQKIEKNVDSLRNERRVNENKRNFYLEILGVME